MTHGNKAIKGVPTKGAPMMKGLDKQSASSAKQHPQRAAKHGSSGKSK